MLAHSPSSFPSHAVRAAAFVAAFFVLEMLYQAGRGTPIEALLVDDLTVRPAAALINRISPGEGVIAQGHTLSSPRERLSVINGCEGAEVVLMLWAAILTFHRGPWRRKLHGLAGGALLVFAVNQARVVALYYSLQYDLTLFGVLHGYVAPLVMVAAAGIYFLFWITHAQPQRAL